MTTRTPVLPGDKVTHLGHPATVVHGYDEDGPWLPPAGQRRPPSVNIRLVPPVRGMSPQMDVPVSALTRKEARDGIRPELALRGLRLALAARREAARWQRVRQLRRRASS